MSATNAEMDRAYEQGKKARKDQTGQSTCPYGTAELNLHGWWMAGWNDVDMED